MKLETFEMERMQSTWENQVRYNLSESGVHALAVEELFPESLGRVRLGYPQTSGTAELRERIAALYPGCSAENVLVTNGGAEANFITTWRFLEPGDSAIVMLPNYMQIWGLARALGAYVEPLWLERSNGRWAPDLDAFEKALSSRTRLIAVCNPNNPTGAILTQDERRAICDGAARVGAAVTPGSPFAREDLDASLEPRALWRREAAALLRYRI